MKKSILIFNHVVACSLFVTNAFSQTPFNTYIVHNADGTSQLRSGMTFAVNQQITTSSVFMKDFDQYSYRQIFSNGNIFAYGTNFNIKGTRLLFDNWVRGAVIKNNGEEINGDKYYFNFDKITNNLLVTIDKQQIIEVYKDSIQSFRFKEHGTLYAFEKFPAIERFRFVQILLKDDEKYSLFKSLHTRFIGSDYQTNGLTETGNPYDEYVDSYKYFIVYKGDVRPVELKFSSIKKALKENSSLAKDYYANHISDEIDESYLSDIVQYVNQ
jgi:hypothetical protein